MQVPGEDVEGEVRATPAARAWAATIGLTAWAALLVQFFVLFARSGSVAASLQTMFVYFTIMTNLLVAVVMAGFAANVAAFKRSSVVAGAALSILLVGVVYHMLLRGLLELSGGSAVANAMLHVATPVLVPVFWLVCVRRGLLRWIDPCIWAMYPLAYLLYALALGRRTGQYAYPFLDAERYGANHVAWYATVLGLSYLGAGFALVLVDRWVGDRLRRRRGPLHY